MAGGTLQDLGVLDYPEGALSSLAVVHMQLCWTFLVG